MTYLINIQNLQLDEQNYRCEIDMLILNDDNDYRKGIGKNKRLCM